MPLRRKIAYSLVVLAFFLLVVEFGLRTFWTQHSWVKCCHWLAGSGQSRAGPKMWPNCEYLNCSDEFTVRFRTSGLGYRAHDHGYSATSSGRDSVYRIAFVGDSFTAGLEVADQKTFCALIESDLRRMTGSRRIYAENYGVSGTGLFEYWHRIVHDVFAGTPPEALVLCIFPGNDFTNPCPDDGFTDGLVPLREYFSTPRLKNHFNTWAVGHSKLAFFLYRKWRDFKTRKSRSTAELENVPTQDWWTRTIPDERVLNGREVQKRFRLLESIVEECQARDVELAVLILGNSPYVTDGTKSPISTILSDEGIDVPILDICAQLGPEFDKYSFEVDGHLNASGHRFVADRAVPFLLEVLQVTTQSP